MCSFSAHKHPYGSPFCYIVKKYPFKCLTCQTKCDVLFVIDPATPLYMRTTAGLLFIGDDMKEAKTISQQIEISKSRNLIVTKYLLLKDLIT